MNLGMEKRYDVFISCKSDDYSKAESVYRWLVDKGHHPFFAPISLAVSTIQGEPVVFGDEIDDALEQVNNMILFATKAEYVSRGYVRDEWRTFVEEQRAGRKSGSLVTILDGVNVASLPIRLRAVQSFTLSNYKTGILRFLRNSSLINGHEYVDLGLPSGTLWATCNLGANEPEGCGNYYAWGETTIKTTYDWATYKYAKGSENTLTKYCDNSEFGNNGFIDNQRILQVSDDPATANWGSRWVIPSKAQWDDLLENSTNQWTIRNGIAGRLFTAKNGRTLFLPALGCRQGNELLNVGWYCFYWSSSLSTPHGAWGLYFVSDDCHMGCGYRSGGFSVRPVCKK